MSSNLDGAVFFLCLYFVVPILIAKFPLKATWKTILTAYGIWFGMLLLFGLSTLQSSSAGEAIGWPMIMGMFLTIPAISLIVFLLRVFKYQ